MSARAAILAAARRHLTSGAPSQTDAQRRATVAKRLAAHQSGTIPARVADGAGHAGANLALFCQMLESQSATIDQVSDPEQIPEAIADYLRAQNLPAQFCHGTDPLLANLDWSTTPQLERRQGPAVEADQVGVAVAHSGVAETGTLVFLSGADNPTISNFLPETHIAIIPASKLCGAYEEVWSRLREQFGSGELPRTVNFISGPSRTGDIEQTLLLGAHGPRRLHVLIVDETGQAQP
ncbi:MAG: LutC/YkgG family protein [Alphaproteobacteria bacterium]